MRNKRGQVGKIITNLPVMILMFISVVLFVVAAAGIILLDRPGEAAALSSGDPSFLLMEVDVEGETLTVFDAYVLFEKGAVERSDLEDELKKLVDERNDCFVLAKGDEEGPAGRTGGEALDDFFVKFEKEEVYSGHTGSTPLLSSKYKEENLINQLSFDVDGRMVYIESYYGGCIEE